MKIDGIHARNIDFAVGPYKKTRRKTSILTLRSVKFAHEMLVLMLISRLKSLASVVPSQCLWGKLQNLSFEGFNSKQVVMSFCVAGVALRDIPTCFMTCQK